MKIGAYQFAVTGEIAFNLEVIKQAISKAVDKNVELLVFPECALTGYPPRDIKSSTVVKFDELSLVYRELQELVDRYEITIICGSIVKEKNEYYNTAIIMRPFEEATYYHKRALWGWDRDNFTRGNQERIIKIGEWKIGIRICFEIRFPEFFRELYDKGTDLNVVLFYDVSDMESEERYDLIKSHIRTRAVENITHILTVNATKPYQTAPTVLFDKSGFLLAELEKNEEGLLIYDLEKKEADFGEKGRREISNWLRYGG